MKNYFSIALRICLGVFFIFSGLVKTRPIEPFEYMLVESGWIGWNLAPYLARLFISLEVLLGLFCIVGVKLRRALTAIGLLLIVFTCYLILQYFTVGNLEDCGCLGTFMSLTTLESIAKNLALLLAVLLIYKLQPFESLRTLPFEKYIIMVCLIVPLLYILRPYKYDSKAIVINEPIDLSGIPAIYGTNDSIDYQSKNALIVFLNPKCSHCINAAKRLKIIDSKTALPPIYFIFYGDETEVIDFMTEQNVSYPFVIYKDDGFMELTQGSYPKIFYIQNGVVDKIWKGDKFDEPELTALSPTI